MRIGQLNSQLTVHLTIAGAEKRGLPMSTGMRAELFTKLNSVVLTGEGNLVISHHNIFETIDRRHWERLEVVQ